ncbi:hypothetical protein, partial [Candidatus Thiosymbion oneisti]|uniref:hypothetical protein n=1 Tax=Candidatus Thiosymbion oneisti TaxID=589554 RepID=UPI001C404EE8
SGYGAFSLGCPRPHRKARLTRPTKLLRHPPWGREMIIRVDSRDAWFPSALEVAQFAKKRKLRKNAMTQGRQAAKKEQRIFASWRPCVLALNGPESERPSIKFLALYGFQTG